MPRDKIDTTVLVESCSADTYDAESHLQESVPHEFFKGFWREFSDICWVLPQSFEDLGCNVDNADAPFCEFVSLIKSIPDNWCKDNYSYSLDKWSRPSENVPIGHLKVYHPEA